MATAHKVEVNAHFHEDDVLQNTVRATQKMFTPQLYEQLHEMHRLSLGFILIAHIAFSQEVRTPLSSNAKKN